MSDRWYQSGWAHAPRITEKSILLPCPVCKGGGDLAEHPWDDEEDCAACYGGGAVRPDDLMRALKTIHAKFDTQDALTVLAELVAIADRIPDHPGLADVDMNEVHALHALLRQ